MNNLELRLRIDRATGKKIVEIDYHSDEDALPMEHEEEHKRLVDEVLKHAGIDPSEVERVEVKPIEQKKREEQGEQEKQSVEN